jgi:hypothetical protein
MEPMMQEPEDEHGRALRILFKAKRQAEKTMSENTFITALIDFTATTALLAEGEDGLRAAMERMERLMVHMRSNPLPGASAKSN